MTFWVSGNGSMLRTLAVLRKNMRIIQGFWGGYFQMDMGGVLTLATHGKPPK